MAAPTADLIGKLTPRQRDCLRLVYAGCSSKEIGRQLAIGPGTVDNHLKAATATLDAASRFAAARMLAQWEQAAGAQTAGEQTAAYPIVDSQTVGIAAVPPVEHLSGRQTLERIDTGATGLRLEDSQLDSQLAGDRAPSRSGL